MSANDPVLAALVVGSVGVCLVWLGASRLASRWAGRGRDGQPSPKGPSEASPESNGPAPASHAPDGLDHDDPRVHAEVYRGISNLRLASLVFCLLALACLYLGISRATALGMAAGALCLQFVAWKKRGDHLRAKRMIPMSREAAKARAARAASDRATGRGTGREKK